MRLTKSVDLRHTKPMNKANINISLPGWCQPFLERKGERFASLELRMQLALDIAGHNIQHGGGPFGAAVFDRAGGLLAIGMNLVTLSNCSVTHAEIVALILAEQDLKNYDLSQQGQQHRQLVTTCEPCTMCLGAVIWSGVDSLVCGARDADARAIGFDEGPKPEHCFAELEHRGIHVNRDVLRAEAVALLQRYQQSGQTIYNAGQLPK